jgi:hypothetical protein
MAGTRESLEGGGHVRRTMDPQTGITSVSGSRQRPYSQQSGESGVFESPPEAESVLEAMPYNKEEPAPGGLNKPLPTRQKPLKNLFPT